MLKKESVAPGGEGEGERIFQGISGDQILHCSACNDHFFVTLDFFFPIIFYKRKQDRT